MGAESPGRCFFVFTQNELTNTLQEINISHLGKRKTIFKMSFLGDMLVPWRVDHLLEDLWVPGGSGLVGHLPYQLRTEVPNAEMRFSVSSGSWKHKTRSGTAPEKICQRWKCSKNSQGSNPTPKKTTSLDELWGLCKWKLYIYLYL